MIRLQISGEEFAPQPALLDDGYDVVGSIATSLLALAASAAIATAAAQPVAPDVEWVSVTKHDADTWAPPLAAGQIGRLAPAYWADEFVPQAVTVTPDSDYWLAPIAVASDAPHPFDLWQDVEWVPVTKHDADMWLAPTYADQIVVKSPWFDESDWSPAKVTVEDWSFVLTAPGAPASVFQLADEDDIVFRPLDTVDGWFPWAPLPDRFVATLYHTDERIVPPTPIADLDATWVAPQWAPPRSVVFVWNDAGEDIATGIDTHPKVLPPGIILRVLPLIVAARVYPQLVALNVGATPTILEASTVPVSRRRSNPEPG